ncbi:tRNA adenosine(34) deaminase TadA [Moraxella nasovis]|uniref:tRNA adenosine(34) deaminase TadA n=1 Tax=Moraxella nasovis TaxID=2904121 RepID=UPI001F6114AD|nr:tRNA adenosine(34) deaminase TadA [Moraxella nasovis]UNU73263.1 tRNA adenosine(34) deaminase TadA [Moraxella nasovis]
MTPFILASTPKVTDLQALQFWSVQDVMMMNKALYLADIGASLGEVPVGAVVVYKGEIIGEGYNRPIIDADPTAHAEIVAVRKACHHLNNYRLPMGATLYITLEPCTMCLGMMVHARISRVVFGATEPKAGVAKSQLSLHTMPFYNHLIDIQGGLLAYECGQRLSQFFKNRRKQKRQTKNVEQAT